MANVDIALHPQEAANALGWLVMAGADAIVDEAPRNWLAAQPRPAERILHPAPPIALALTPAMARGAMARGPVPAPAPAVDSLIDAADLAGLDAALAHFAHPLRRPEPPQLLGGNIASRLVILADQPEPADGEAERLLARMLAAIGLDTDAVARGHLLPWRLPAGRAPRDEEVTAFAPFLHRALALAAPRLVLALGDRAANCAGMAAPRGIASLRGKWQALGEVPMIATFHPRQLLAQPELKRLAWADLQDFRQRMVAR